MPDQSIAMTTSTPPLTTTRYTAAIDHAATRFVATRWFHASSETQIKYSAWLHPDTTAPSLDDPTNIIITPEASFAAKAVLPATELRPICLDIPPTHKNITLQVANGTATLTALAQVSYSFQ